MRSWGPLGEAFEGHGAQDVHFEGPNGQNLKNLRFLKVFRGGPDLRGHAHSMVKGRVAGVVESSKHRYCNHQVT